jgi:hypothetical protein
MSPRRCLWATNNSMDIYQFNTNIITFAPLLFVAISVCRIARAARVAPLFVSHKRPVTLPIPSPLTITPQALLYAH